MITKLLHSLGVIVSGLGELCKMIEGGVQNNEGNRTDVIDACGIDPTTE